MLSLHTNVASLRIQNALNQTQAALTTSMVRLGTGQRINSAADDAAGLQIATRLIGQTKGMAVASQNTQNAISMFQTAEGAMNEVTSVLNRMKELATQSADAAYSDDDRASMQSEYDALGLELQNILTNTTYAGEKLFTDGNGLTISAGGKLGSVSGISFQVGATSAEQMTFSGRLTLSSVVSGLSGLTEAFTTASGLGSGFSGLEITTAAAANAKIDEIATMINTVGSLVGLMGAAQNRLQHTSANLTNMQVNTEDSQSRIMNTDYSSESAREAQLKILQQAGGSMLKQASEMNQMVLSLLQ